MEAADKIVKDAIKKAPPEFEEGDSVDVHVQIREGDKTRIQVFSGTVIAIRGSGIRQNFTVRRIVQGEGVERTFPMQAPTVVDVKIKKKGRVRRAKLYYLRDRVGKGTRVKERAWTAQKKKAPKAKAKPESPEEPTAEKAEESSGD